MISFTQALLGQMQACLVKNFGWQARMINRKQERQLLGDANQALID
jgi:hypothetical protein